MHLGPIDKPFVPHNLIWTHESPVPSLKFQLAPRLKILMSSGPKKGTQVYFFLKSPGKRTPSMFPNRAPMKTEALLQSILRLSQNLHLSGSPVKYPSLKVTFMESLSEWCPNTTALLHSSFKVPGVRTPPSPRRIPGSPQMERAPPWKETPLSGDFLNIRSIALHGAETLTHSGSRSETPGKFWNMVLEKNAGDQLARSCEKWRSVTYSQWTEENPTWNK